MSLKILIIDDEKDICFLISEILKDEKYITETAENSKEALEKFISFKPDLIILDVWLGNSELDGIELLKEFKRINSIIPVIIISGHGTVDMAVQAIKNGAYDFLEKPFNSDKIVIITQRALESAKLISENAFLKKIATPNNPIIGESPFIINLKKNLKKISENKSRILISGPRGSGKKIIAYNIHKMSSKSQNLANIIDFKNLNQNDLEPMFKEDKNNINKNLLINSNNKTLILNNIDYLPLNFQKKLLFYIESNHFYKKYDIELNIKIIAITTKNIENEIEKGNFLRNLFNRLNVVSINVPSISNRRKDILPICNYYLDYFNVNKNNNFILSKKSSDKLEAYNWPGNVLQIVNYIEKTIILNQDMNLESDFELKDLPIDMGENDSNSLEITDLTMNLKDARYQFEKKYFLSQISRFNGNISKISEFTGMERTALYRKFKSLKISLDKT